MPGLSILSHDFNDPDWAPPEDPYDFDFWMNVTLGDARGGSNFQVHVCSPISIRHLRDKRGCFMLDAWRGEEDLIAHLRAFVESEVESHSSEDPHIVLSKHWLWEYAGMK